MRGELELVLAGLAIGPLGRPEEALGTAVRALELGADATRILVVLDILVEAEQTRARAATMLVDVHAQLGELSELAFRRKRWICLRLDRFRRA